MTATIVGREEKDLTRFAFAIQQLAEGRSNAGGSCTLTANAATTTVTAKNCGTGSVPILVPTTAHAAAEIGNGTMYISSVKAGSFVVTHANNSQTDRTYLFVCIG